MSVSVFYINANECMNCKACMAACNDVHNLSPELHLRKVLQAEAGEWKFKEGITQQINVFSYSLSLSCNHCNNPICVDSCPRQAIIKDPDNGIVFIDLDLCIGCGICTKQCPYHAPVVDTRIKKALKCDTCFNLRNKGESPACVAACSMRCLSFYTGDTLEDVIATIQSEHNQTPESLTIIFPGQNALLPNPETTNPNLALTPHRRDAGLTSDDIVTHHI